MVALFGIKREDIFFKNNLEPLKVKQKVKKDLPPILPASTKENIIVLFWLIKLTRNWRLRTGGESQQ
jgi:hypothetical protein